jgi:hypothetical protein
MSSKLLRTGPVGAVLLAVLCTGCALPPEQGEEKQEKVYRTGSNIPQRDRTAPDVSVMNPSVIQDQTRSRGNPVGTSR